MAEDFTRWIFRAHDFMINEVETEGDEDVYYVSPPLNITRPNDIISLFALHGITITRVGLAGDEISVRIQRPKET